MALTITTLLDQNTISISSDTEPSDTEPSDTEKDLLVSIFDEIKNQGGVDNYESLNSIVNSIDSNYLFAFTIGKVNLSKTNENEIVLVDINTSNENRLCIFSEINLN